MTILDGSPSGVAIPVVQIIPAAILPRSPELVLGDYVPVVRNGANVVVPIEAFQSPPGAGIRSAGVSNLGNTLGMTGLITAGWLALAGIGVATLGQATDANGATVSISVPAQSAQTQHVHDVTLSGNVAGAPALVSSGTLTLAGGPNVTLSQAGNAISISAAAGGAFSAGVSNLGNTAGQTGVTGTRLVFAGINSVTLSQSTDANGATISISGPTQSAESNTIGMSNLGNTAGTSGVISGPQVRLLFAGGNNVTLSQSINGASATVTISAFNQSVQTQSRFNLTISGNTAGAGALVSSGTLTLAGGANITLSQNGNAITVSGPAPSNVTLSNWLPQQPYFTGTLALSNGALFLAPFVLPHNATATHAWLNYSVSAGSTGTMLATVSQHVGIYTRNGSTLSLFSSAFQSFLASYTSTQSSASFNGLRQLILPFSLNLTPGEYWLGQNAFTLGVNVTLSHVVVNSGLSNAFSGRWAAAPNGSVQPVNFGWGQYSATTVALPNSIAFSDIQGAGAANLLFTPFAGFAAVSA